MCGYKWKTKIYNRTILKKECPYCSNKIVIIGKNDLKTLRPDIANQWNYNKNKDLKPEQFSIGSGKKVWWICEKKMSGKLLYCTEHSEMEQIVQFVILLAKNSQTRTGV